jgi:hypothetical protein
MCLFEDALLKKMSKCINVRQARVFSLLVRLWLAILQYAAALRL